VIRRCEFKLVYEAVQRSGVANDVQVLLAPDKTGRPRRLTADVFFTGAVLVALNGRTLTLDNVHKALTLWIPNSLQYEIGTRIKTKKGVRGEPISVHQVRYLFSAIERRLEFTAEQVPSLTDTEREIRSEALQDIIDKLLAASLPAQMPKTVSLAWDSSGVESWGTPKWRATPTSDEEVADLDDVDKNDGRDDGEGVADDDAGAVAGAAKVGKHGRTLRSFDADARYGYRTKTHDNHSSTLFGYDLFAGVGVLPVGTPADTMPKLVFALTLRPASGSTSTPTLELINRLRERDVTVEEILVDRGFSYKVPQDWAMKLRELGIAQVQDIHPADHGIRDYEGIRVVDGTPHCASMPKELANISRPARFKVAPLKKRASKVDRLHHERSTKELDEFHTKIAERQKYAFVFHGNNPTTQDPNQTRWICPAKAGKLKCTLCPFSAFYASDMTEVASPPPASTAPKCCTQQTVSIPGSALVKLRQREYWGSPEWIGSYGRRNHIESIFGNLRNPSTQNIKRGFCRVVGLVKTSLMLTFEAVAANIRLIRQWSKRTGDITDPLSVPMPVSHGFEELGEDGQIDFAEPFDGPPEDLAT
jgi:hypothetical protein